MTTMPQVILVASLIVKQRENQRKQSSDLLSTWRNDTIDSGGRHKTESKALDRQQVWKPSDRQQRVINEILPSFLCNLEQLKSFRQVAREILWWLDLASHRRYNSSKHAQ